MVNQEAGRGQDVMKKMAQPTRSALVHVEKLLRQMGVALRSRGLYPPDNPIPLDAIQKLHRLMVDFLEKEGELRLAVTKDGFAFGSKSVGQNNRVLSKLALQLYTRSISQISCYVGVEERELVNFLAVIDLDPLDIKYRGGVANLLWESDVSNIAARELKTKVVDAETRQEAIGEEGPFLTENESMLLDKLLKEEDFVQGHRRVLLRMVGEPNEIKSFIQKVAGMELSIEQRGEDKASAIYEAMKKLGSLINGELPDEQSRLFRNLAEALLLLDNETKVSLFSKKLLPNQEIDATSRALLGQMSPRELADLLVSIAKNEPESVLELSEAFGSIPRLTEDQQRLQHVIEEALKYAGFTQEALALQQSREEARNSEVPSVDEATEPAELDILHAVGQISAFSEEEERSIKKMVRLDERETTVHASKTLIDLLYLEERFESFTQIMKQLEEIFPILFRQKEFSVSTDVLKALKEIGSLRSNQPEFEERAQQTFAKISLPSNIELLISSTKPPTSSGENQEDILSCLTLLDREAVISLLLKRLAAETNRSLRKTFCNLLVRLGKYELHMLGSYTTDQEWYVVRNIALILGMIGSQEALPYVNRIIKHHDVRVRLEAVRALGAIKGGAAVDLLTAATGDKEQSVQLAAVISLEKLKEPKAILHLARIIQKRDLFGKDFKLQLETAKALGTANSKEAVQALEVLLRRRVWFGKARDRELKKQALLSLQRIQAPEADMVLKHIGGPKQ